MCNIEKQKKKKEETAVSIFGRLIVFLQENFVVWDTFPKMIQDKLKNYLQT